MTMHIIAINCPPVMSAAIFLKILHGYLLSSYCSLRFCGFKQDLFIKEMRFIG